jgi:calcium binding protein 39
VITTMSFFGLGGKKLPKPSDLVKHTREALSAFEKKDNNNTKNLEKANEELSKCLQGMKIILYGDTEHEVNQDGVVTLANDIYAADLIPLMLTYLSKFEFEAKKDVALIFNNLLRRQVGSRSPTVEYICRNTGILDTLATGYETTDIALTCGSMLRECCRHESLTKLVLYSPSLWKYFKYVEVANFDMASDAFATLKELLTKHKPLVAEFLEKNYDQFFEYYTGLLNSANYVTRRQSLKMLGELLLDRANFNIMTKYISDQQNLKLMMTLLRDKSRSIQFEAFHVFKVFVANPNKPPTILNILVKNREKLVSFLSNFHNDKDDDQFNDEKAFLLKQIQQLPSA